MDHSSASTISVADSQSSLPGYESQSSQTLPSDRERGSRSSSVNRSDTNSDASRYHRVKKPINEAVATAFTEATQQHPLPPEVLNQITSQVTANVLQHLKTSNFPPSMVTPQPVTIPEAAPDSVSSIATSPPLDRTQVYTPPSPHRETAPSKQTSPTYPSFAAASRHPPSPPSTTRGVSPHGMTSQSDDSDGKDERPCRPSAPLRISTDGDATTLEKCWGKLFDDEQPTARMNQFLRGIAMHIIDDYEPKNSLVITPEKLQRYYKDTKLPHELYPWDDVFDDRTSSISRMFREFRIQHHLTQAVPSERPDVPALTPQGFAAWMTLVFLTDPESEFERLAYTALHMPISNPDDKKERFPKELSRRMLPKESNRPLAVNLAKSMRTHCHVKITPRANSGSEPDARPAVADRTSRLPPPTVAPTGHRHSYVDASAGAKPRTSNSRRASYTGRSPGPSIRESSTEFAVDDAAESVPAFKPIERERKPYVAAPGGGKNHDQVESQQTSAQPTPMDSNRKIKRSTSVNGNGRPSDASTRYLPVSVHQPSTSMSELPNQDPPPRRRAGSFAGSQPRSSRNRSPSATRSNPRASDNEIKPGMVYAAGSSGHSNSFQWRDPRYDGPREPRVSFSDQRDRGREPRSRPDGPRYNDEDYYRQAAVNSYPPDGQGYAAYPPNSYRTK